MKTKQDEGAYGIAKLFDITKKAGYNRELYVESGIVVSEPPNLRIEVDGDLILEADDLVVAEHLTKHTRQVRIDSGSVVSLAFDDELCLGDRVIIVADDETDEYYVIDRVVEYDAT